MDFSWNEEQLELKNAMVEFARNRLDRGIDEGEDEDGHFPHDRWNECARMGIQALSIPEEYGGSGADILTTMLIMEGLGYGSRDNGLIFALNAQMWSVQHPILAFGTDDQKNRYLPGLCGGELIGAHGMSEPDSGSDAYSLQTRAERKGGRYVLNGQKTFVTNAPAADLFVVFATVDRQKGIGGITAFLIDVDNPGLAVGAPLSKMGLASAPMAEVFLEDCELSEENRLGPEGAGVPVFNSSMEWERACILASHVGAMDRQLETCIRYARDRRQFGQPIGKFQSVANRIADMKVRVETARLLLYKVAWLKSQKKPAVLEAAMAKLYLSECFVQSSLDAIRIHGGYGYMKEFAVEGDLRDAIGGVLYSGTSDIQRVVIARWLGL